MRRAPIAASRTAYKYESIMDFRTSQSPETTQLKSTLHSLTRREDSDNGFTGERSIHSRITNTATNTVETQKADYSEKTIQFQNGVFFDTRGTEKKEAQSTTASNRIDRLGGRNRSKSLERNTDNNSSQLTVKSNRQLGRLSTFFRVHGVASDGRRDGPETHANHVRSGNDVDFSEHEPDAEFSQSRNVVNTLKFQSLEKSDTENHDRLEEDNVGYSGVPRSKYRKRSAQQESVRFVPSTSRADILED